MYRQNLRKATEKVLETMTADGVINMHLSVGYLFDSERGIYSELSIYFEKLTNVYFSKEDDDLEDIGYTFDILVLEPSLARFLLEECESAVDKLFQIAPKVLFLTDAAFLASKVRRHVFEKSLCYAYPIVSGLDRDMYGSVWLLLDRAYQGEPVTHNIPCDSWEYNHELDAEINRPYHLQKITEYLWDDVYGLLSGYIDTYNLHGDDLGFVLSRISANLQDMLGKE